MAKLQAENALASNGPSPINKWEPKTNMALTEKSKRALGADHWVSKQDIAHLHVNVIGDVATLTGHVMQAGNKARAETAVRETPGVKTVINHLVVDTQLIIDVAQALGHAPQTQHERIQVNVQHGVVYLAGIVNRAAVRVAATQIAAGIPQTRGIVNVIETAGIELDRDEERFVQPLIGSKIYAIDGYIGRVQQVVINPHNRRVSAVMVQARLAVPPKVDWTHVPIERLQPPRLLLMPISRIRCAASGALFLTVNSSEAAHFADFAPHSFGPPPADWQPPYPYVPADTCWARGCAGEDRR